MKKKILILAFSTISIGIFLSINPFSEILPKLRQVKLSYIYIFVVFVLIEHIFRALRWQIMLKNSHPGVKLFPTFLALLMSFFSNIFIPHSGIVTRLSYLKKFYKFPPTVNLGTFIAEKTGDSLMVVLLLSFTFLYSGFSINKVVDITHSSQNFLLILTLVIFTGFLVFVLVKTVLKKQFLKLQTRAKEYARSVWSGFHGLKDRKSLMLFSVYTLIIWFLYLFTFNIMFLSVDIVPSKTCLINTACIGNLSWIFPSQAGIGAYHVAVSTSLRFHGYSALDSSFLSVLTHSGILFTDFIFGLSSLLITTFWSFRFSKPAMQETIIAVAE